LSPVSLNIEWKFMNLSVVVPAYNEELGIKLFLADLKSTLDALNIDYEVVLVNDGSNDQTLLKALELEWANLIIIDFYANAGHMFALEAGLKASTGKYVVTMDADFQHPIELIPTFYAKISGKNVDVIQGVRKRGNEESLLRKISARLFYCFMNRMTVSHTITNAGDFRIMSREVVNQLNSLGENNKIYRFLIPKLGYKIETFEFNSKKREFGYSKYNFPKLMKLALDSVFRFSITPLTLVFKLGIIVLALTIFYCLIILYQYTQGETPEGWTSIIVAILGIGSFQLLSLSIVGNYVAQILIGQRNRPEYVIRKIYTKNEKLNEE